MKILQWLSLILGFTCMAHGCHVSPEPTAAAKVIFRYNEPQGIQSLDPTDALHLAHLRATSMLTETLVKPDGTPGLASSWSADERKMRWYFTLRSGVLFHPNASGISDTLSSNDVLASFQRLKTKPRAAWILHPVAEMKVETDSTLIF
jgi:peptide/nickel transport system substrate-binding protein